MKTTLFTLIIVLVFAGAVQADLTAPAEKKPAPAAAAPEEGFRFTFEDIDEVLIDAGACRTAMILMIIQFFFFLIVSKFTRMEFSSLPNALIVAFIYGLIFFLVLVARVQFWNVGYQDALPINLIIANACMLIIAPKIFKANIYESMFLALALVAETVAGMVITRMLVARNQSAFDYIASLI